MTVWVPLVINCNLGLQQWALPTALLFLAAVTFYFFKVEISFGLETNYRYLGCGLLQDDFLPRTPTPLEDIFRSIFW